jgi:hypothetical protein
LHQFIDLEELTERDEEAVLPQFSIAQDDLAVTVEGIWVGGFTRGIEEAFHPALDHAGGTSRIGDKLVGLEIPEFHLGSKGAVDGLKLHVETAVDHAASGLRRNAGKTQFFRIVAKGRLEVVDEKPVAKGNPVDLRVAFDRGAGAQIRTKIEAKEFCDDASV